MMHATLLIYAELFANLVKIGAKQKQTGTIYLIHFEKPIGNLSHPLSSAQHYMGWCSDLDKRLDRHRSGQGSSIMRYVEQSGVGWNVVRTWQGTRDDERALKNQKNAKRFCPVCQGTSTI